jgi:hypothetical protein
MIFPCGSTVRSPVPMKDSLPYYYQQSAMSLLFMFLDTSSSSTGTMDGCSFYIFTFQCPLFFSIHINEFVTGKREDRMGTD